MHTCVEPNICCLHAKNIRPEPYWYVYSMYVCTDGLYMYTCRLSLLQGLPTRLGTQSGTQARLPWEICSLCTWLQLASQVCIHVCMHACIYLCCGCHYRFVCVNTYTNTYMHTQKSSPTTLLRASSCPSRSTSPYTHTLTSTCIQTHIHTHTELISNNAAAGLLLPIALNIAK